jgi:hypothetical protein
MQQNDQILRGKGVLTMCDTYKANIIEANGKRFYVCQHDLEFIEAITGVNDVSILDDDTKEAFCNLLENVNVHLMKLGSCSICASPIFFDEKTYIKVDNGYVCKTCFYEFQDQILKALNADNVDTEEAEEEEEEEEEI